jgi:putative ABC transport system ATP-binding protein
MSGARHALIADGIAQRLLEGSQSRTTLACLTRRFDPGRFHVVRGPSGSGKTTLLSILSLTVTAAQGSISWGSSNLTRLDPAAQAVWRRQNLGLVFQTSRLVGVLTPVEHIRLAAAIRNRPDAVGNGLAMLDALGLGSQLDRLPAQLSGGEKQRVAIAQALCSHPSVLLADEPTAALDHGNAALVAETLRGFAHRHGAVVICVSHDQVVIDAADDLLTLEKA